ncbi:hypothetical protein G6F59_013701 [Rhizopus arrhizus]|nr:hypothetical protein G6F59_013701 [Rhizopus arrhizus]
MGGAEACEPRFAPTGEWLVRTCQATSPTPAQPQRRPRRQQQQPVPPVDAAAAVHRRMCRPVLRQAADADLGQRLRSGLPWPVAWRPARPRAASLLQVVPRRAARVRAEQPRPGAGAGGRLVRQRLRGPRRGGVAHDGVLHAVHTRMHMAAVLQPRRQRGIRAGAALIDHHVARHLAGDARPAVARHHVQRQVDAGRDAAAAGAVAVDDHAPGIGHSAELFQVGARAPVRRGPVALQQARRPLQHRARADAGDPFGAGAHTCNRVQQRVVLHGLENGQAAARHQQYVGRLGHVTEVMRGAHGQARIRHHLAFGGRHEFEFHLRHHRPYGHGAHHVLQGESGEHETHYLHRCTY